MSVAKLLAGGAVDAARGLLGHELIQGSVRLRIVETEAYRPGDSASHAWRGRTARNAPMWGPPGQLYVYLCYGMHWMLNLVCEEEGSAAAVLIRGCEVVDGHAVVEARRGGRLDLLGPGKVGQALALDATWSGRPLERGLSLVAGGEVGEIVVGPRVGIDYAEPADRVLPWRFMCGSATRRSNVRKGEARGTSS